jgi:NADH-quinone oxidoreductase subunit N
MRFLNLNTGHPALIQTLVLLSAASMTFGNLIALVQQDLKRLLAYSSIAHAGYILMGLLAFNQIGDTAAVYYITVYLMINLGCFYVIAKISPQGKNVSFSGLCGLYRRSPWLAATLAVSALSLAGIPPTAGFTGKLFLFTAAFKAGHSYLVVLAAINCAISLFFYLNMVRHAYTLEPEGLSPVFLSGSDYLINMFFIFIIIFLGILPDTLVNIALNVIINLV